VRSSILALWCLAIPLAAVAGEADVLKVKATLASDGTCRFDATVQHADAGWDHYADVWEVVAPNGSVLGTRTLLHPHVDEQPFTRSLAGIAIPDAITAVTVRARDSVHGYGGRGLTVSLPRP
jgi:hypothetical protein